MKISQFTYFVTTTILHEACVSDNSIVDVAYSFDDYSLIINETIGINVRLINSLKYIAKQQGMKKARLGKPVVFSN